MATPNTTTKHGKSPSKRAMPAASPTAKVIDESDRVTLPGDIHANQGEGNRTAARNYDAGVEAYIESGRSDAAAKAAAKAIDGPEGKDLRAAEEVGKAGHPTVNKA